MQCLSWHSFQEALTYISTWLPISSWTSGLLGISFPPYWLWDGNASSARLTLKLMFLFTWALLFFSTGAWHGHGWVCLHLNKLAAFSNRGRTCTLQLLCPCALAPQLPDLELGLAVALKPFPVVKSMCFQNTSITKSPWIEPFWIFIQEHKQIIS